MTQNDIPSSWRVTFYRWWPILLAAALIALRKVASPQAIETWYSRRFFAVLRAGWDHSLALAPFPLFYLFWLVILLGVGWLIRRFFRDRRRQAPAWSRLGRSLVVSLAWLLIVFFLGWGFNYGRQPVEEVMGFTPYPPPLNELRTRVRAQADTLAELRRKITTDTLALEASVFPSRLETAVRPLLVNALVRHGYPAPGRPRARILLPRGILLHLSTAGVYWPWAGEGNIDGGLHPLQQPAVMAHELAHAYGFGYEGTCTFWAWLAGRETGDPALEYAFRLAYWRRIAGRLRQQEPEEYWAWRAAHLDPGIRNDLQAIYDNGQRYRNLAPVIRDVTYDAYLKAQGVHEGIINYGRVVPLVEGYLRAPAD